MPADDVSRDHNGWRGSAELDALLTASRKKLESNWLEVTGSITVQLADAPDLWRLLSAINSSTVKLHSRARTSRLDLSAFDRWLAHPANGGLGLLETLRSTSPLVDRKRNAADKAAIKTAALDDARAILQSSSNDDWVDRWLPSLLNQDGSLGGRIGVDALAVAARVLALLPVDGLSLTELAEQACGDTKALTSGGASKLVLDALSLREGVARPVDPVSVRLLWATAGVSVDALSSRVVVLNFAVTEDHVVARWLDDATAHGIPFTLTLDMITRGPLTGVADRVFVCENISVVAAAARTLAGRSAALVCTDGQPSAAVHKLLAGLRPGTVVHWRNDFDWAGLHMTSRAVARYGALPWRMTSEDYLRALDTRNSEPLKGSTADRTEPSAWDPALADAMHRSGRAVMEERLIPDLLNDLDTTSAKRDTQ